MGTIIWLQNEIVNCKSAINDGTTLSKKKKTYRNYYTTYKFPIRLKTCAMITSFERTIIHIICTVTEAFLKAFKIFGNYAGSKPSKKKLEFLREMMQNVKVFFFSCGEYDAWEKQKQSDSETGCFFLLSWDPSYGKKISEISPSNTLFFFFGLRDNP